MVKVWFEPVTESDFSGSIAWHCKHGIVYKVWEVDGEMAQVSGMFYLTRIPDGVFYHFCVVDESVKARPWTLFKAFRKGFRLYADVPLQLVHIPSDKVEIIGMLERFGFEVISTYADGKGTLLQRKTLARK